jgi:Mn-dependent DtxR family transcriptional regulator
VHGKDVDAETIFTENPQDYDATDADVERVADYLKKGHVSEISEISLALGIEGAVVAVCINRLQYRGLVGLTTDDPHKFFINV